MDGYEIFEGHIGYLKEFERARELRLEAGFSDIKISDLFTSDEKPCLIYMMAGNDDEKIETKIFAGRWVPRLRSYNNMVIVHPDSIKEPEYDDLGGKIVKFYILYKPDEKRFYKGRDYEAAVFRDRDKLQSSYTVAGEPERIFEAVIREFEEKGYAFERR